LEILISAKNGLTRLEHTTRCLCKTRASRAGSILSFFPNRVAWASSTTRQSFSLLVARVGDSVRSNPAVKYFSSAEVSTTTRYLGSSDTASTIRCVSAHILLISFTEILTLELSPHSSLKALTGALTFLVVRSYLLSISPKHEPVQLQQKHSRERFRYSVILCRIFWCA
jgi:hypothetical protein